MKLLILTQKVDINDDVLGFFHSWLKEFAKHCEKLTVICLYQGEYDLPENVEVYSLGKEKKNFQLLSRINYVFRFYKYIWQERNNYDKVFVHMNAVYAVLGGPLWRLWKKRIALWYTHRQVSLTLRLAEKLVHRVFSASKESFTLDSAKLKVLGHGIDTEYFQLPKEKKPNSKLEIVSVGRITRIKNLDILLAAGQILAAQKDFLFRLRLIGQPNNPQDEEYLTELKKYVKDNKLEDYIEFLGPVPNRQILPYYQESDLAINLSPTGGMDKAVLEALACGLPVIAFNQTFTRLLPYQLMLNNLDARELADKIVEARGVDMEKSRSEVLSQYNMEALVRGIILDLK